MWPWSTIRRLRDALAEKTKEAELWERSYNRANERYDAAISREAGLLDEQRALRRRLAALTTRGPGGRFVKVDQVGGKSSGEIGH